jgi:hypothetical protein
VPLFRAILWLTALDSLLLGLWALTRPGDLCALLQIAPPRDPDALLWPLNGALTLTHAYCLLLAFARPGRNVGLVLPPLIGRALLAAVWLWLLAAGHGGAWPLGWLALHDAVVVGLYAGCLAYGWRIRRAREAAPAIME